jgi:hypothetical protein
MKKVFFLILILTVSTFAFEGPDIMLIGDLYLPSRGQFNLVLADSNTNGVGVFLSNALLYNISSLRWYYGGAIYHSKLGALGFCLRDYGIKNLYSATETRLFIQKLLLKKLTLGVGYLHDSYEYGDNLYRGGNDFLFANSAAYYGTLHFALQVDKIALNRKIKSLDKRPELLTSLYWQADNILAFYASLYRNTEKRFRLRIGQDMQLVKPLTLNAGFLTEPQVYYVGLEIVYKRMEFGYTYYDIGDLPNSSRITISYR